MARNRIAHRCTACGHQEPKWTGRCPGCGEWGTLVGDVERGGPADGPAPAPARPIVDVLPCEAPAHETGLTEVDRVLGGGLVPGSVTLVGGEPGVGKSTLLLQILAGAAGRGRRVLYVSAEESAAQVRARAERLGACHPRVWLAAERDLDRILGHLAEVAPAIAVVDSVQAIADPSLDSSPGTPLQVRECTGRLVTAAKVAGVAVVLVGHVTKEGTLAGPRVLEHLVDTVLSFEGDRHHALRLLRALKHRYGATEELGVLEMGDSGLRGLPDPSSVFLADRAPGIAGSVVVPTLDGHRPLLVELQALVAPSPAAAPRRCAEGVDAGRLGLLLAVLDRRAGVHVLARDVYALAVGGLQVREPGADLALACAVASAAADRPLPADLVVCGEVGLGGELRRVGRLEHRLAEAARLGLRRVLLPRGAPPVPGGMRELRASTVVEALAMVGLGPTAPRPPRSSLGRAN